MKEKNVPKIITKYQFISNTKISNILIIFQVIDVLSLFFVFLSTFCFILQTSEDMLDQPTQNFLQFLDNLTVVIFTIEYVTRFVCSPRKIMFLRNVMNAIDLLAIVPFYISLTLDHLEDVKIIGKAGKTIRLVRILRVIRIFKLVRHFAGLQSLIRTLYEAYKELVLLMVMVTIAIFTFSILMYFAEKDVDKAQQEINSLTGNKI